MDYLILSNIVTGTATLIASLSSVTLKDYLDNKKAKRKEVRQKAIEAYSLVSRLTDSLVPIRVKCLGFLNGGQFNNYECDYNTLDILHQIELIVIGWTNKVEAEYELVSTETLRVYKNFLNILSKKEKITMDDLCLDQLSTNAKELKVKLKKFYL
ncbi:TPA: hypothetical protein ACT9A3_000095 [Legionella pneumophila]|nr:hypothetical protein [Legionella pneumophila]HAU0882809.1 hypothetical protein [Legionella pneumophila]HCD9576987.1 hypothetical protein [Legionella pneumophila]HDO7947813.1 hypothetical protein [Legionella pneumophila]HDO7951315.1 hypothetical protein [Legionella pneumophila]